MKPFYELPIGSRRFLLAVCALGAASVVPFEAPWLQMAGMLVAGLAVWATHAAFHRHCRRRRQLHQMNDWLVSCLALAIDARDPATTGHKQRVCYYATEVARRLGLAGKDADAVRIAAILHDIGKLGIPDSILLKPDKLSPKEYALARRHVEIGNAILQPVPFEGPVVSIIRSHHERWDGRGYPVGLSGEQIPLGARIVAVVDVFDALTSDRPYRRALSRETAFDFLRERAGSHFDPRVVQALLEVEPHREDQCGSAWQIGALLPEVEESSPPGAQFAYREIARVNEELYALWEVSHGVPCILSLGNVLALSLEKAQSLVGFTTGVIFLRSDDAPEVRAARVVGRYEDRLAGMAIRLGEGSSGLAALNGIVLVNVSPSQDLGRRAFPGETLDLGAALVVPLRAGECILGTISLYHTDYNHFTEVHVRRLTIIAEHAALAIENAREYERTRLLALTDPLTGLPSARYLGCYLEQALLARTGPLAILLLDCDGLREINERFGYAEGNRALRMVARLVQMELRERDLQVRYGGDAFVLVLPGVAAAAARRLAERLRQVVDAATCLTDIGERYSIGVSIGLAMYPEDGGDPRALLAAAGARMCEDKAARRPARVGVAA
ncbi:MAG: diguanylate cyclase [Armatimonadetes bacterium]|nr:diguanylate cyclase [Armatimonadota bacterium]